MLTRSIELLLRSAALLSCLGLAACAGSASLPGAEPGPDLVSAPGGNPAIVRAAGGGGARGGATTAGVQAPAEPADPQADPLTQARANCWMKVESQKGLRGIDQRIAFVDRCVADQMKNGPTP